MSIIINDVIYIQSITDYHHCIIKASLIARIRWIIVIIHISNLSSDFFAPICRDALPKSAVRLWRKSTGALSELEMEKSYVSPETSLFSVSPRYLIWLLLWWRATKFIENKQGIKTQAIIEVIEWEKSNEHCSRGAFISEIRFWSMTRSMDM